MASSLVSPHIEVLPGRGGTLRREGLRVVGAFVALLVAGLLVTAGLIWRESARARVQASPPPAAAAQR